MFKSRFKLLMVMFCVSVLLLGGTLIFCANNQNLGGNVDVTYTAPPQTDDLWNVNNKTFIKNNLNALLQKISNDSYSSIDNMSTVDSLATTKTTAGTMRTFATGKNSGEDISVILGGLTWTATYLSKDKDGNTILTLWLDNCIQEAWKDRLADEGEYYGFLNGGLYGAFSANWFKDNPNENYPSNMYGASYIRTVTLNNGGAVATSGTTSKDYGQNSNSVFALFTMSDGGLTNYLVKPRQVEWQEYGQNAKKLFDFNCSAPNENWSNQIPTNGTYMGQTYFFSSYYGAPYNYVDNEYNDRWADDYLWLPSLSETGCSSNMKGIWDLSVTQRYNADGSTSTSTVGSVGSANGNANNYCWTRSGKGDHASYAYTFSPSGDFYSDDTVNNNRAVRPALHLNLTEAVKNAK